jgi:DNA-binding CsgD family transcriptional regulator
MAASPAQIALKNERMDQVAELLSIGLERAEISERLGFGIRNFDKYLQGIRQRLGSQAV